MQSIDQLANLITDLNPSDQETLLDKVAQLNFQKGLRDLGEKYRARLARENRLTSSRDQIWTELNIIREKIAEHDYPA
jgi:regulator of sigma D